MAAAASVLKIEPLVTKLIFYPSLAQSAARRPRPLVRITLHYTTTCTPTSTQPSRQSEPVHWVSLLASQLVELVVR